MAGVARAVEIRLAIRDADAAVQKLREFGTQGESALKKIVTASAPVDSALKNVDNAFARSAAAQKEFNNELNRLGQTSGQFKSGLAGIGFQVQDFAVQVGSGQSALVAFTQQAPQLLGAFGGIGIAIGTAVAVAGALGLAFGAIRSPADDAKAAADSFSKAMEDVDFTVGSSLTNLRSLREELKGLSDDQVQGAQFNVEKKVNEVNAALREQAQILESEVGQQFAAALEIGFNQSAQEVDKNVKLVEQLKTEFDALEAGDPLSRVIANIRDLTDANSNGSPAAAALKDRLAELYTNALALEGQLKATGVAVNVMAEAMGGSGNDALFSPEQLKQQAAALQTLEATRRIRTQIANDNEEEFDAERTRAEQRKQLDEQEASSLARLAKQQADQRAETLANAKTSIATEIANQNELIAAYGVSTEAVEAAERAQRARSEVTQAGLDIDSAAGQALYAQALAAEELTAKVEDLGNAERERGQKAAKAAADAQRSADRAQAETTRKLEQEAQRQAELIQKPFENAIQSVQAAFSDGFVDIFNGGVDSFSDLAGTIKTIFIRLAAEIATLMVIQPVLGGISGGMPGMPGVGGGGIGGIGSMFSSVGSMIGSSSIGTAINGFGASTGLFSAASGGAASSVAGLGSIGAGGGAAGLSGAGISGASASTMGISGASAATLTSTLGVAALGYFGGQALAGLTGGNAQGAGIGGGLGAGIGFAVGGPIGALIGGVGGSLLGGLFGGGKPANKEQGVNYNLSTGISSTYGDTGKKFSQENADAAQTIAQAAAQFAEKLASQTGGRVGLGGFDVAVGSRDGFKLGTGDTVQEFGSVEELTAALIEKITKSLKGAGAETQKLIGSGKLDFSDAQATEQALSIAAAVDAMIKPVNESRNAIEEINKTFEDLISKAAALGISTKELSAAQAQQIGDVRLGVQAQIDAAVGASDSGAMLTLAIKEVVTQFKSLQEAGEAVGADTSKLAKAQNDQINVLQAAQKAQLQAEAEAKKAAAEAVAKNKASVQEQVDAFKSGTDAGSKMRAEVQAVRDRFLELTIAARAAGVSTAGLAEAQKAQAQAVQAAYREQIKAAAEAKRQERESAAASIASFVGAGTPGSELQDQIRSIQQQFQSLSETARRLGLSTDGLVRSMQQQIAAAREAQIASNKASAASFAQNVYSFRGATDPEFAIAAQQQAIKVQFDSIVAEAKRLNQSLDLGALTKSMQAQAVAVRTAANEAAAAAKQAREQEKAARAKEKDSVALQIMQFKGATDSSAALAYQIAAIKAQFTALTADANRLGLSTSGLSTAMNAQIDAAKKASEEAKKQAAEQKAAQISSTQLSILGFRAAADSGLALDYQIAQIKSQFDELSKAAKGLGLSEAGLAKARDDQIANAKKQAEEAKKAADDAKAKEITSARDQIRAFLSVGDAGAELQLQILSIQRNFTDLTELAKRLGLSTAGLAAAQDKQIEATKKQATETAKLAAEQARQAVQGAADDQRSFFSNLAGPFKAILASFDLNKVGGLGRSFRANESEVERQFALAQAGDVAALQALPDLINTTRDQVNQLAASGPKTASTEARLEEITKQVLKLIETNAKAAEANGPAAIVEKLSDIIATFKAKIDELKAQQIASDQTLATILRSIR